MVVRQVASHLSHLLACPRACVGRQIGHPLGPAGGVGGGGEQSGGEHGHNLHQQHNFERHRPTWSRSKTSLVLALKLDLNLQIKDEMMVIELNEN